MMILLDKNNKPQNTIYYLSGVIHFLIQTNDGVDYAEVYSKLVASEEKKINIEFFSLALDFLYLTEKVLLDEKGGLHVH